MFGGIVVIAVGILVPSGIVRAQSRDSDFGVVGPVTIDSDGLDISTGLDFRGETCRFCTTTGVGAFLGLWSTQGTLLASSTASGEDFGTSLVVERDDLPGEGKIDVMVTVQVREPVKSTTSVSTFDTDTGKTNSPLADAYG